MTGIAIGFLILSVVLVWGGFVASVEYLRRRPSLAEYPPGGEDDHREDQGPVERDT